MGSQQPESGEIMIKGFPGEFNYLEFPTVMIVMAACTLFTFYLHRGMVSFSGRNLELQFGMTLQAFVIGDLVAQYMALGAFRNSFQLGMHIGKIPGGKLGRQPAAGHQKH